MKTRLTILSSDPAALRHEIESSVHLQHTDHVASTEEGVRITTDRSLAQMLSVLELCGFRYTEGTAR